MKNFEKYWDSIQNHLICGFVQETPLCAYCYDENFETCDTCEERLKEFLFADVECNEIKNGHPVYVLGKHYSEATLMSMTKAELIHLLDIAQNNYSCVLESYVNATEYAEKLLKGVEENDN